MDLCQSIDSHGSWEGASEKPDAGSAFQNLHHPMVLSQSSSPAEPLTTWVSRVKPAHPRLLTVGHGWLDTSTQTILKLTFPKFLPLASASMGFKSSLSRGQLALRATQLEVTNNSFTASHCSLLAIHTLTAHCALSYPQSTSNCAPTHIQPDLCSLLSSSQGCSFWQSTQRPFLMSLSGPHMPTPRQVLSCLLLLFSS